MKNELTVKHTTTPRAREKKNPLLSTLNQHGQLNPRACERHQRIPRPSGGMRGGRAHSRSPPGPPSQNPLRASSSCTTLCPGTTRRLVFPMPGGWCRPLVGGYHSAWSYFARTRSISAHCENARTPGVVGHDAMVLIPPPVIYLKTMAPFDSPVEEVIFGQWSQG